jgi:hypothetical protein
MFAGIIAEWRCVPVDKKEDEEMKSRNGRGKKLIIYNIQSVRMAMELAPWFAGNGSSFAFQS